MSDTDLNGYVMSLQPYEVGRANWGWSLRPKDPNIPKSWHGVQPTFGDALDKMLDVLKGLPDLRTSPEEAGLWPLLKGS